MNDNLTVAIDTMAEQIAVKLGEIAELKRATNTLCKVAGVEPRYPDAEQDPTTGVALKMRPDEYYGKPFSTAARAYLERRRQAVESEDIMKGLEQGGFDFDAIGWKPETRLRAVASSLAKNTAIFHKLPNGMVGLKEWYPEAVERRKGRKTEQETNGSENSKNETVSE